MRSATCVATSPVAATQQVEQKLKAREAVSLVWMELAMFGVAALVYVAQLRCTSKEPAVRSVLSQM